MPIFIYLNSFSILMKENIAQNDFEFRKLRLSDAPIILSQVKDMHKKYSEKSHDTLKSVKTDIRKSWSDMRYKKRYEYGIIFQNNFIGTITATPNFQNKRCELGYYIAPEYWGEGFFHKMLREFILYLFKQNFNKVYFRVRSDNPRGIKALEKFGAKKEGIIRAYFYEKGKEIDAHYFGILKKEFKKFIKQ